MATSPSRPLSIPLTLARRLAVTKQLLAGPRPTPTPTGMMTVFDHLGCIQIDPIPVVDRTQYLVMFSRIGPYDRAAFDRLIYQDRRLFEFWAHAASIVRTADLPIHRHFMDRPVNPNPKSEWVKRFRNWVKENEGFREYVLESLRERGPLAAEDIEDRAVVNWESSGWSSSRNVNLMLEILWDRGKIFVANRKGTRKYWDIPERVLPGLASVEKISSEEVVRRGAQISLQALGVATEKQIKVHFIRGRYPGLGKVLKDLTEEGKVQEVEVVGDAASSEFNGQPLPGKWYIHAGDLPLLDQLQNGAWGPRTVLLSPFDNLICDRERTELLFDYEFRIEIYVPKAKRKYGYYVLSVLDGDRFIGRIDPRMDRKTGVLTLNAVHTEPGVEVNHTTGQAVAGAVRELAEFLDAEEIVTNGTAPEGWKKALAKL